LAFLRLDLADLTTIKASAEEFLSKETKLHVLFNNAGVMCPPQGSKTPQGYELQLGTNNIGTFMFTKLLTPILNATARKELPSAVRVIWVASSATTPGGLFMDNLDYHNDKSAMVKYAISKVTKWVTTFTRLDMLNDIKPTAS
jgi:retinol dehydrogenase-12